MSLLRPSDKKGHAPLSQMRPASRVGQRGLTRQAEPHPVSWLLKVGVLIVGSVLVLFAYMMLTTTGEERAVYVGAIVTIVCTVAWGLFRGGSKAHPPWSS